MPKSSKKKTVVKDPTLPDATATAPPEPASDPPAGSTAVAAPATSTAVGSTAPPDVDIPQVSSSFVPVNQKDYLGTHAKAGQIALLPEAIAELSSQSTTYAELLGSSAPPSAKVATDLTIAGKWTNLRTALEGFLVFVKSNEAVAWKLAQHDLDLLDVVFEAITTLNPSVPELLPAIAALLAVPKVIAQRGVATRARKRQAKATTTPAASAATASATPAPTAAPVVNPSAGGGTPAK